MPLEKCSPPWHTHLGPRGSRGQTRGWGRLRAAWWGSSWPYGGTGRPHSFGIKSLGAQPGRRDTGSPSGCREHPSPHLKFDSHCAAPGQRPSHWAPFPGSPGSLWAPDIERPQGQAGSCPGVTGAPQRPNVQPQPRIQCGALYGDQRTCPITRGGLPNPLTALAWNRGPGAGGRHRPCAQAVSHPRLPAHHGFFTRSSRLCRQGHSGGSVKGPPRIWWEPHRRWNRAPAGEHVTSRLGHQHFNQQKECQHIPKPAPSASHHHGGKHRIW